MGGSSKEITSEQIRQEIDKNQRVLAKCKAENEKYTKEHTKSIREFTISISKAKKELASLEVELKSLPQNATPEQVLSVESAVNSTTTQLSTLRTTRELKLEAYKQKKQELQDQENELLSIIELLEKSEMEALAREKALEQERKEQEALLKIKQKFGKNAVLKATSLLEGATAKERNNQIGGHKK